MRSKCLGYTVVLLTAITLSALAQPALAQAEGPSDTAFLSPYWKYAVSRWEPIVLRYAEQRQLDPDLVAAVIWKESRGRSTARGPAGAVGLMMVMPFPWRPSSKELQNPWTNLSWGARALAQTIRDGNGDLYYSLAAYNGSWEKVERDSTRRYAASVLDYYSRAVAVRHGLPVDGDWVAIFAVEGSPRSSTITVLGPRRSLARYTPRPWLQADIPTVPQGVPPHSTAITFVDAYGGECRVNVWLTAPDGSPLVPPAPQAAASVRKPLSAERSRGMQACEYLVCP